MKGIFKRRSVGATGKAGDNCTRAAQAPGTREAPGARLGVPAGNRTRRAETSVSASCPSGDVRRPGGQQT